MQRIRELDGLRGFAVALVVFGHYIHHPSLRFFGPQWGWIGVNLFFVLSGFLITTILLRADEDAPLKKFYARRILRIFPLYYGVLLVYFLASACAGTPQPWNTSVVYLFFLQAILPPTLTHLQIVPHPDWVIMGFSVLWTLSVEELFYLLWAPLVVRTQTRRKRLQQGLVLVLLLTPVLRFFYPDPHWIQESFLGQMDSLAAGALLAVVWKTHVTTLRPWAQKHARSLYGVCGVLLSGAIWIDWATGIPYKASMYLRMFNAAEYTLLWAAWAALLLATLASSGMLRIIPRTLRHRALVWLGSISYCLYLVHYPIFLFWRNYLPHTVALPIALATSLAISALSLRVLEKPLAQWKQRKFPYRESPQLATAELFDRD